MCHLHRTLQSPSRGVLPSHRLGRTPPNAVTDTRTFATGPPVSALTTRPPNSTVTVGVAVIPGTGDGPSGHLLQPGVMTTATPRLAMTTRARALLRIMSRRGGGGPESFACPPWQRASLRSRARSGVGETRFFDSFGLCSRQTKSWLTKAASRSSG